LSARHQTTPHIGSDGGRLKRLLAGQNRKRLTQ